ncbi:Cysteine desulfurase [Thermococcus sp. 2319x1]|uniref:aminotransferase class V-fold PLP-dependent enzyme n=1 Tax=Thermococcus sp. 2319x1 TaxID=1674923 RepID=UPI00073AC46E|nr:aminotransferase class V-fold PLP-dependent enzyme [Thermococcus sp. 2319x1]ALV62837.1 Cysteine desulfurase [Thermococcus sp. 2319x1]
MGIKHLFPGLKNFKAYLNTASAGFLPLTALKRIMDFSSYLVDFREGADSVDFLEKEIMEKVLEEGAKLFHTSKENLTLTIQTTEGLKRLLSSLEPRRGMNIVSFDMEFPSLACLLKSYAKRYSLELRIVKNKGGWYFIEDVEKAVDDNTFAVIGSSVQWISGQRMSLREISKVAHEHGAWLIVDAVQHAGSLGLYPEREGVDAFVAGGEKWLLNPSVGSGIMYISNELIEEASPVAGLLNMKPPMGEWSSWWGMPEKNPWGEFELRNDARKLDFGGGPPYLMATALWGALELINALNIEKIEKHNIKLAGKIRDEALSLGLEVIGNENWENSAIVTIKTGLSYEKEEEIYQQMIAEGIKVSHRGALGHYGIRASPHLYNEMEDVERFLDSLVDSLSKL